MGTILAGKYRIVRRLGEGGMGVVYEAMHTRIEQRVAIKMLLPEVLDVPDVVSRFEREARAAGKLRSENTARVLDVDVTDAGLPYMVMELLDGSDLGKMLERTGPLPIPTAVDFVLQACNAMAEAHAAGVIHRDLKPSNLFVTEAGKVKVLDFGISKVENDKDARVTATKTVVGTPLYMSPEQVRSAKHVDARSDIWSLGIIMYELLCGRTPFEGSTTAAAAAICIDEPPPIATYRQGVPGELEHAVMTALQKDANARYQTVQAFAAAIAHFGSGSVHLPDTSQGVRAPASSHASLPGIRAVESARTLPHSDPSVPPNVTERSAPVGTLPGWTNRSAPRGHRGWWIAAAAVSALATAVVIAFFVGRTRPSVVDNPRGDRQLGADLGVPTASPVIPSASVPIAVAVPSVAVSHDVGSKPTAHHASASSAAATTHTTTPAPIPTRL